MLPAWLHKPIPLPRIDIDPARWFLHLGIAMWVALLVVKAIAIPNLPLHWDEFWFLSLVHAGSRGELTNGFQMLHVLLFSWLRGHGDEITQLRIARTVMWMLLAISSGLLFQLARRWCESRPALLAPLVFLAASPVMFHGGAFRSDSLLLPLCVGTLLCLSSPRQSRASLGWAGVLWGLGAAITIKAVLLAPVAGVLLFASPWPGFRKASTRVAWVGLCASMTLVATTSLQSALMHYAASNAQVASAAGEAGLKVFSAWLPHPHEFTWLLQADRLLWVMMGLGALALLYRRNILAGLVLSFLPVLFYRNTFDYYYVLMFAPPSLLVALLAQEIIAAHRAKLFPVTVPRLGPVRARELDRAYWVLLALLFGVYLVASDNATRLGWVHGQDEQVPVVRMVHQIFPQPVPYIDHSGVIATFPKANGFLSGWGIENYRAENAPFLPKLLKTSKPPLMLADRDVLAPGSWRHKKLLPQDQRLIASSYIQVWGPIWVAGARLPATGRVFLPFAGAYRLQSATPVALQGVQHAPGDVIAVSDQQVASGLTVACATAPCLGSLVWAAAHLPSVPYAGKGRFFALPR